MSLLETPISRLDGTPSTLGELTSGRTTLIVNVASRCGKTPQYAGLEQLHERYSGRGFTVIGVPCNQFGDQEPGTREEIATFCSTTYGVTFPMTDKVDVNGATRHPVYDVLTSRQDATGEAGDVMWNFEKFLLAPDGEVVARYRPNVVPDDPRLLADLEAQLD